MTCSLCLARVIKARLCPMNTLAPFFSPPFLSGKSSLHNATTSSFSAATNVSTPEEEAQEIREKLDEPRKVGCSWSEGIRERASEFTKSNLLKTTRSFLWDGDVVLLVFIDNEEEEGEVEDGE